jgi:phospholipase A-2-activating protein
MSTRRNFPVLRRCRTRERRMARYRHLYLIEDPRLYTQVIMVRNGDSVEAYMWSAATRSWTNVGQVVDAVGSNRKRIFNGVEYDFVFDVDIQEGQPPLKLPYNLSENPFEAARKFLEDNELPISYLDTVGNFIVQNSQGVSIGQESGPQQHAAEPWGSENRYRPGEASSQAPLPPPARSKVLPQTEYLTISTANLSLVENKARQLNDQLAQEGKSDIVMTSEELATFTELCSVLGSKKPPGQAGFELLNRLLQSWPSQHRLPVLDLLRLAAGVSPLVAQMNLVKLFKSSGTISAEFPNNVMLAVRAFANIFQTEEGRKYAQDSYEEVCLPFWKHSGCLTINR